MNDTTAFIETLTARLNGVLKCYYQKAPTDDDGNVPDGVFPYCVVSGVLATPLEGGEQGDMVSFYVDVWTDEKKDDSTVELERYCDSVRAHLHNAVLSKSGVFTGHIGFDSQNDMTEMDFDLTHRRLSFAARVFYYGGR